ncbi:hypothetical protein WMY93_022660 [Mugilogobius chulae]|uniref:Uncharacterized protein n=1 Tax=Mugilogobius chulae TaxID=88201 RepID=A0AAW0NAN9_9GOBI
MATSRNSKLEVTSCTTSFLPLFRRVSNECYVEFVTYALCVYVHTDDVEFEVSSDRRTGKPIAVKLLKIKPEVLPEERISGQVVSAIPAYLDGKSAPGQVPTGSVCYERNGVQLTPPRLKDVLSAPIRTFGSYAPELWTGVTANPRRGAAGRWRTGASDQVSHENGSAWDIMNERLQSTLEQHPLLITAQ